MILAGLLLSFDVKQEKTFSGLEKEKFVSKVSGKPTALYVLTNKNGMEVCVTNYGCRVVSIMAPDRDGKMTDVALGFDNIGEYTANSGGVFGAVIGRVANRIGNASFTLDGVEYQLPKNSGANCIHGGPEGFQNQVWDAVQPENQTLELNYLSKDGEMGFPGNLNVKVTYTLTDGNSLDMLYEATTDKPTVVNLTNHSYFNLSGNDGSNILDHLIQINADRYTVTDNQLIPTSEIASVEGKPLDLRELTAIGSRIDDPFLGRTGFDHNFVLNANGDVTRLAAKAISPKTGICMEVYTNEPGVQFYCGMGSRGGKFGVTYARRGAFCLETQHFADSPNKPDFPSVVLRPGEKYVSKCIYKFLIINHS
ncbi:MAG: galactose mutarotase [Tannerella sp.]|nr:galactose mutarotase [Tannerella sp.]